MASLAKSARVALSFLSLCMAALPAHSQNPTAVIGKQRAAVSSLEWEIREAGHPILGNIRFAFLRKPFETPVGKDKVYSVAYVSCQKATKLLAIELTNMKAPEDPGGLRPGKSPRLVCSRPIPAGDGRLVQEELPLKWEVNEIGDAMARGLPPHALRQCVSLGIVQDVGLPETWSQETARVVYAIPPYAKELDEIFATCGEASVYAAAPPPPPPAREAATAWRTAHVASGGKTNVRAQPNVQSPVVTQLDPGSAVLVRKVKADWWRARPPSGAAFEGYIREDRLVLK